jgi:hypothetical protein
MNRLALLTAMALLGIGLTLAQNTQSTKPLSDQSNSSNQSTQPQSSEPATPGKDQNAGAMPSHQAGQQGKGDPAHSGLPDTTVRDQQNSTTSTTGAAGQDNTPPSPSTMGTSGSTPGASEPPQQQTAPQNTPSPDQQPNPSTQPDATTPHAALLQTPAARAVATHTPDPGTCMNPASLQTSGDGTAVAPPPCR